MNTISCMSANFVAREVNYQMRDWGQGDAATNAFFQPLETFPTRFGELMREIRAMGFEAVDIWTAHLHPQWATEQHIHHARAILDAHGLTPISLAGGFGKTPAELEAACRLASALGVNILGGSTALLKEDRATAIALCKKYGVRLGIENHPEKTPQELMEKIGDSGAGTVGAALDTGSFASRGYDAASAIQELAGHLVYVHFRDVVEVGNDDSTALGDGCISFPECIRVLKQLNYTGAISIEHNPPDHNPTQDCMTSLARLKQWLQESDS